MNTPTRNNRLLSKEESMNLFINNCKNLLPREEVYSRSVIIEKNGFRTKEQKKYYQKENYFIPENLEFVAEQLLSRDNVYVALTPCEYYFNKEGEYVTELVTQTHRSGLEYSETDIIKDVDDYLKKGAIVYVYTYVGMYLNMVIGHEMMVKKDVKTYWWRIAIKQE